MICLLSSKQRYCWMTYKILDNILILNMMSPKDNNDAKKKLINSTLNKISKSCLKKANLKEDPIVLQQQQMKATSTIQYSKHFFAKPIINNNSNNNGSNTSINASNRTCNLIGKMMINDVSKSTISGLGHNKQSDKTTTTIIAETTEITTSGTNTGTTVLTKYSRNCSEGGKNIAHDDVHNNNHYRDNERQRNFEITSLNEVNRENLSLVDEETLVDITSVQHQQQEEFAREEVKGESLVTVKSPLLLQNFSKRMRHKNITVIPLDDSHQRTVDLDALKTREQISQCELLEFNTSTIEKLPQKDYKTDCELKFKSLAERKALLKKEFFKDLNVSTNTSATNASAVKLKFSNQTLNKRIFKKQHNLKLKIPKDCNKLLEHQQSRVDLSLSLVALRKLDLQKKQQTELKSVTKTLKNTHFPIVKELAKRFDLKSNMILPQTKNNATEAKPSKFESMAERQSPLSDEGCNIGHSPYSSDDDNDSIRTTNTAIQRIPDAKQKDKVARSASSDSALGLDVDEPMDITEQQQPHQQKRRMTLTVTDLPLRPALLPLAEPTLLPDSPILDLPSPNLGNNLQQNQIPSKVLLEERVVEIPEDNRSGFSSRRESSQSCFSDFQPGEMQGVRFVRTPSVVVSDYSDDITCGITLEEIEYFRAQRLRRRRSSLETSGTEKDANDNNSDISASSSCSNLYYCGSTISALDGAECLVNGVRQQLERKTSDCSTCSASGDEETSTYFCIPEQPEDCQDITDMLANQHLTSKYSKKVGMAGNLLTLDTTNIA